MRGSPKIAVVDYCAGNLRSVANALEYVGADYYISGFPEELMRGDKLIFPGVGHARSAMEHLDRSGLSDMLRAYADSGRPFMGICLGSQILLDRSEEGNSRGLGIIKGHCRLFSSPGLKVPQIGWNRVTPQRAHYLFNGIQTGTSFYFVHSYYTELEDASNILCSTEYGVNYASGVVRDNVCAVQFHPERSGVWGLKMLENFVKAV